MTTINATNAKQNFGNCLMKVAAGPILVEKSGKPAVAMLSYAEYQRLLVIENTMLLTEARAAAEDGFLGEDEADEWAQVMNEKYVADKKAQDK